MLVIKDCGVHEVWGLGELYRVVEGPRRNYGGRRVSIRRILVTSGTGTGILFQGL